MVRRATVDGYLVRPTSHREGGDDRCGTRGRTTTSTSRTTCRARAAAMRCTPSWGATTGVTASLSRCRATSTWPPPDGPATTGSGDRRYVELRHRAQPRPMRPVLHLASGPPEVQPVLEQLEHAPVVVVPGPSRQPP